MKNTWLMLDVDGCLSPGRWGAYDLKAIQSVNSRISESELRVCLSSGRSQPYLEAVSQMLNSVELLVCENGSSIFEIASGKFLFSTDIESLSAIRNQIEDALGNSIIFEPGKQTTLSINLSRETNITGIEELFNLVGEIIELPDYLIATHSSSAVDIIPRSTNKGTALIFLTDQGMLQRNNTIGFGDSINDLSFLKLTARSGAPSNSHAEVKKIADYIAPRPNALGLVDYLNSI